MRFSRSIHRNMDFDIIYQIACEHERRSPQTYGEWLDMGFDRANDRYYVLIVAEKVEGDIIEETKVFINKYGCIVEMVVRFF